MSTPAHPVSHPQRPTGRSIRWTMILSVLVALALEPVAEADYLGSVTPSVAAPQNPQSGDSRASAQLRQNHFPARTSSAGAGAVVGGGYWDDRFGPGAGGISGRVLAVATAGNGDVYAGGLFTVAGGVPANFIARWDGTAWSPLGSGMNALVFTIAIAGNGDVYAGGVFNMAGGVPVNHIARWDGTQWSPLGSGTNAPVVGLAIAGNGDVYAGGAFSTAGGVPVNYIARWDGTQWFPVGNGVSCCVLTVAATGNGDVYAGGGFTTAGFVPANYIARWDGAQWSALGTGIGAGFENRVETIAIAGNGDVYAGGQFTTAGGASANNIARWDGTQWSALGTGTNSDVFTTAVAGNGDVYVGGYFTTAGGVQVNYITRWDGTAWSSLGSGMNNWVEAIDIADSGDAYAGGAFTTAGGLPSSNIALWHPAGQGSPTPTRTTAPTSTGTAVPPTGTSTPVVTATSTTAATATPTTCTITFSDVPVTDPFYTFITCLACRDVLGGYGDGTFRPYNNITRGQVSKVVSNAAGLDDDVSGQIYADVPPTETFYIWIMRLSNRGYMSGYPCGGAGEPCDPQSRPYFRPYSNATRGQLSKIVAQAAEISDPVPPAQQTYADVLPSNPFWLWIEQLTARGVMSGYPCGSVGEPCDPQSRPYFRWTNNVTRGQASKIVANTFFPGCNP